MPNPNPITMASSPTITKKRKYAPDNALGLSPMPCPSDSKPLRGRPPGTGRKQLLAPLGELMNASAGDAYATHVITVETGEDIVKRLSSFSEERPRALCILSGVGKVSSVTFCKFGTSEQSLSFQGPYDILSLGGSYLVNKQGGPQNRTGSVSVSLCNDTGHVIGGVAGKLMADSLVQIVVGSFVYGNAKAKAVKQANESKEERNNGMDKTPNSEPLWPPPETESAVEAALLPLDFSSPGWSGYGGGNRNN